MNKYDVKMTNKLKEGDKVKIDIEKFQWKKDSYTPIFLQWLEDNRDTIFTVMKRGKNDIMWAIEEDSKWLLYCDDLIKVE
jgi:hypothetical protein